MPDVSDWTFHPKYVEPFYRHFMNANIVREPPEVRAPLLAEFRLRATELDDCQLGEMLESTWRPAKVAAWYVAYGQRVGCVPRIQTLLTGRPAHVEHLCIALARVRHPGTSAALLSYLEGCASGGLHVPWNEEAVSPEWVVCVLKYLDAVGDAQAADELWARFMARLRGGLLVANTPSRFGHTLLSSWAQRLDEARETLQATMTLFDRDLGRD